MNNRLILIAALGLLIPAIANADYTPFDIKIKPNSPLPEVGVFSDDPSRIKYTRSRGGEQEFEIEVRGQCPKAHEKLIDVDLYVDGQHILDIPVSGNNRSLTGNSGKTWEAHTIQVNFDDDHEPLINLCKAEASERLQTQSHDEVFNANFVTGWTDSGKRVELRYECFSTVGFSDILYPKADLLARSRCEATGYESQLYVEEAQLEVSPITGRDGTCKINIDGQFSTNYELYRHRSNNSTADLRYRFKYQAGNGSSHVETSEWWEKTLNPLNAGMVVFNYTDRIPSSIQGGKVSLEVDIDGELYQGKPVPFSMDCTKALPLQQTQTLDLSLSVSADKSETIPLGGQLCPTHAILSGEINAGYPINGNMVIMGTMITDLHVMPINLAAEQSATQEKRIKLNWPSATNTLSLNGGTASNALKKQTLQYGLRISNSNAQVVKSLPRKPYTISCEYPSVNPLLPANNTSLGMIPDHTGGGGAPTSLQGKSPFSRQNNNGKKVHAGLRSDGELVQARKPLNLLKHELSHARQQGRMLSDADTNEMHSATQQRQPKNIPPGPTPIPYPTFGSKNADNPTANELKNVYVKSWSTSGDADDRPTNSETTKARHKLANRPSKSQKNKPTLFKGRIGSRCKRTHFPKKAVIKQSGRQRVVECVNGKVVINRAQKVQQPWQAGDPVFEAYGIEKGPKKEFRSNDLGDEMPDDLPAG